MAGKNSNPVSIDMAKQIVKLSEEGRSISEISLITDLHSTTINKVLKGTYQSFSNKLSPRQIQEFLNACFRPLEQ